MKKITLFLILAISVLTPWAAAYGFWHEAPTGQMLFYYISDSTSTAIVTYPGDLHWPEYAKPTGALTIPSSVTYDGRTYAVTGLGMFAFRECSGLTSVTIPNSVTSIDFGAFSKCSGLTSITIPNSVTTIDDCAFSKCTSLISVNIPSSVASLGAEAFYGCTSLTSVTIPNSVTSIGAAAFCDCSGLTSVTIGNSVTSIGQKAFSGCSSLTKISIPNPNKKLYPNIASDAFSDCPSTIKSQLNTIFAAERSQTHAGFFKLGGTYTFTDNKGRKCKLYLYMGESRAKAQLTIGGTTYYGTLGGYKNGYIIRFDYDDSPYFTVNGQSSRKTTLYIRKGKIYLSETAADAENPKLGYQLYYREIDFE